MKLLRLLLRVTFFLVMFIGFNGLSIWIANEALGFGSTHLLMFIALPEYQNDPDRLIYPEKRVNGVLEINEMGNSDDRKRAKVT